jgi:hypothetical protein
VTAPEGSRGHGPILLTGLDRSGKTALRGRLNAHPAIHIARRTALYSSVDGKFGDLRLPSALDACLAAVAARPGLSEILGDRAAFTRRVRAGPVTYDRVFDVLLEGLAASHGARHWGEQDTDLMWSASRLLQRIPDARVIHVVRDPRRRHAIVRADRPKTVGLVGATTAAWLTSARLAIAGRNADPARYRIVRYEDLANGPAAVVDGLVRWLGEAPAGMPKAVSDEQPPIRASDARFIEHHAGAEMRLLGYEGQDRRGPGSGGVGYRIRMIPATARYQARLALDRRRVRSGSGQA